MKKRIVVLLTLILVSVSALEAQENFKQSLSGIKQVRIEVNTSVKIKAGGSGELVMSKLNDSDNGSYNYDYDSDERKKEKADKKKGMKPIYANGVDNTGFGMSIEKEGDVLIIKDLKSFINQSNLAITLPKSIDVKVNCGNLGDAKIEGFSSEIEANANVGDLTLVDVTGPITAHTSTGEINVKFSNVNQSSPISITSSTGDVDVSLPTNTKANLELRSSMGTIYSDFDFEVKREDGMKRIGAIRKVEKQLNSGGVKIMLRSSTGDVYLRKSNN